MRNTFEVICDHLGGSSWLQSSRLCALLAFDPPEANAEFHGQVLLNEESGGRAVLGVSIQAALRWLGKSPIALTLSQGRHVAAGDFSWCDYGDP
ncbi:MAG: hypothetical protein NTV57_18450 [Cyanobacteria bacterium]|nr:hypothetical protein [Cyanobacteriota bacterium]